MRWSFVLLLPFMAVAPAVLAGEADVLEARAIPMGNGAYRFDVTVQHADTGWDHYADGWEILAPDGTVLSARTLLHPHVDEQPFTRSLTGVVVPAGITEVTVRAHDSVDGYGGREAVVEIPRE
jgi:hypothetical protein